MTINIYEEYESNEQPLFSTSDGYLRAKNLMNKMKTPQQQKQYISIGNMHHWGNVCVSSVNHCGFSSCRSSGSTSPF